APSRSGSRRNPSTRRCGAPSRRRGGRKLCSHSPRAEIAAGARLPDTARRPRGRGRSSSGVSGNRRLGRYAAMTPSSIVVILIGIVLALLINYILGIIVILIGLAMLLMPMLGGTRRV